MTETKLLSVIIPEGRKSKFTEIVCRHFLKGQDFEIIHAKSWQEGLRRARGEYICFLDPDCDFSNDYFEDNMRVFTSQPSFRKLAMVASAVDLSSRDKLYGYILNLEGSFPWVSPSRIKSSTNPYKAQIGYLPGAIVRRAALYRTDIDASDPVASSIKVSLDMWSNGSMVYINPKTTYVPGTESRLDLSYKLVNVPPKMAMLGQMFSREMIG